MNKILVLTWKHFLKYWYYFFLETECTCNADGAVTQSCDANTGECTCHPNIIGHNCDESETGFFGFPTPKGFLLYSKK